MARGHQSAGVWRVESSLDADFKPDSASADEAGYEALQIQIGAKAKRL